jgi:hypothetical protein
MDNTLWGYEQYQRWLNNQNIDISHVNKLDFYNISINQISDNISRFINLKEFYLQSTNVSVLPESIGNLTKLHTLILTNNHLTSLPESIGNLTKLHTLILTNNHLTSLPESIGNLTKLYNLNINGNINIKQLPDNIDDLRNLRVLDIDNTNIHELPYTIIYLRNLRELYCSNIIEIPDILENQIRQYQNIANHNFDNRFNNNYNNHLNNFNNHYNHNIHNNINNINNQNIINREIHNYNNIAQSAIAFQIHNAFKFINLDELRQFYIDNNITIRLFNSNNEFIEYLKNKFILFITKCDKHKQNKNIICFNKIYINILNKIEYDNKYKTIISLTLDFVNTQSDDFISNYADTYIEETLNAYGDIKNINYNSTQYMSCINGSIERFITSLLPSLTLFKNTNIYNNKKYDILVSILTNKPLILTTHGIFKKYAEECYNKYPDNVNKFRNCIKQKMKNIFKNAYNNSKANNELKELINSFGLYGGKRKYFTKKQNKKYKHTLKNKKQRYSIKYKPVMKNRITLKNIK